MSHIAAFLDRRVQEASTLDELARLSETMHVALARARLLARSRPSRVEVRYADGVAEASGVSLLHVLRLPKAVDVVFGFVHEAGMPGWTIAATKKGGLTFAEQWCGLGALGTCSLELWATVGRYLRTHGHHGYLRACVERYLLGDDANHLLGVEDTPRDTHDELIAVAARGVSYVGEEWWISEKKERALERYLRDVQQQLRVARTFRVPMGPLDLAVDQSTPHVHMDGKRVPTCIVNYLAASDAPERLSFHSARTRFVVGSVLHPAVMQLMPQALPPHEREAAAKQVLRNMFITNSTYSETMQPTDIARPFLVVSIRARGPGLTLAMSAMCNFRDDSGYHEWMTSRFRKLELKLSVHGLVLKTPQPAAKALAKQLFAVCVASHDPYYPSIKASMMNSQDDLGIEDTDTEAWARMLVAARKWAASLG